MPESDLDGVSANLGEVLRAADALLVEWSQFGASVRDQVQRETAQIGRAVSDGTGAAVERAVRDQLAALTRELSHLEQRVRIASRGLHEQRVYGRRWLAGIAGGLTIAIVLLVVLLVLVARRPGSATPAPVPAERAEVAPSLPPPDARPADVTAPPFVDAAPPADAPPPPADAARPARRR
jgi:hypothetical protein